MEQEHLDPLLTLAEAAEYLRVSERWLADLARAGGIAATKTARRWVFSTNAIRAYVALHTASPTAGALSDLEDDGVLHVELAPPHAWDPYERSAASTKVVRRKAR